LTFFIFNRKLDSVFPEQIIAKKTMDHKDNSMTCWVVTNGGAGMENQCMGLAHALGVEPKVLRIRLRSPWRELSPYLRFGLGFAHSDAGDKLLPPWPDLLIASGRASVPASLYVRSVSQRNGPRRTFTVQVQDPVIRPTYFDLVVTPVHDGLCGANVISTLGSLHRLTREKLADAAVDFRSRIAHLPRPYIAVLFGGPSRAYELTKHETIGIVAKLNKLARETGGTLLVTPSRRTGEDNLRILKSGFGTIPSYVWDMESPNPYWGILGLADAVLVTADSVNMVTEACFTGKPVHVIDLPGGSPKFDLFHKTLHEAGFSRPFEGKIEKWTYEPLDEVRRVAAEVKKRMQASQA
jgi:mitochondrial fission protein ELM1